MDNRNKPIFQPDGKNAIHDGIEHEPTGESFGYLREFVHVFKLGSAIVRAIRLTKAVYENRLFRAVM